MGKIKKVIFLPIVIVLVLVFALINKSNKIIVEKDIPGNIADIKNVTVSSPSISEVDSLPTLSSLSACHESGSKNICNINSDQEIAWGFGICNSSQEALTKSLLSTQVNLKVDGILLADDIILQRDKKYNQSNRPTTPYCHMWTVKLNNWHKGSTVYLENKAITPDLSPQDNIFEIFIK